MTQRYDGLMHLLKAPSKQFVNQLFTRAFALRFELIGLLNREEDDYAPDPLATTTLSARTFVQSAVSELSIKPNEAIDMSRSVLAIITDSLYNKCTSSDDVERLFPTSFQANLRSLVAKVVAASISEWKEDTLNSMVSLPKLVDLNWRLDIKSASHTISRMTAPTVLVQMQVQQPAAQVGQLNSMQYVTFELNKETLATLLSGFGKIRDQLGSIA